MKNSIFTTGVILLTSLLVAIGPAMIVADEEDSDSTSMSRGKGKGKGGGGGKGKGKGRRSMDENSNTPDSAEKPLVTPESPMDERKLAFFEERILPVLEARCYDCHESGGKMRGGLALDSQAATLAGGDTGPAIIPGNAEGSLLFQAITYEDPDFEMPPKERLAAAVVKDFKTWIDIGAPDNRTGPAPSPAFDPAAGFVTTISEIDGDEITFAKADPSSASASMGGGKGKGKGRSRGSSGDETTLPVSDAVLITTATSARRTGDLLVGIELPGGLTNEHFQDIGRFGLRARIVVDGGEISEINVLVSQEEADTPIAIKPKRPPSKS